jgi:hypothetical protein
MRIFRTWTFKWWEMGLIKICLLALGIILGLYFYDSLVGLLWLWWSLFIVTWIYFIIKLIRL